MLLCIKQFKLNLEKKKKKNRKENQNLTKRGQISQVIRLSTHFYTRAHTRYNIPLYFQSGSQLVSHLTIIINNILILISKLNKTTTTKTKMENRKQKTENQNQNNRLEIIRQTEEEIANERLFNSRKRLETHASCPMAHTPSCTCFLSK